MGQSNLIRIAAVLAFTSVVANSVIAAERRSVPSVAGLQSMDAVKAYCSNIRDLAKDARYRRQSDELKRLSAQVESKIAALHKRISEYKKWYQLRQEFSKKATESLVQIYSRMRPDSAAAQLSVMNKLAAAALIIKLDTRIASAILNEIEPGKAAKLSGIISAAARKSNAGDPS